jgi:hypothetical protein
LRLFAKLLCGQSSRRRVPASLRLVPDSSRLRSEVRSSVTRS